MVLKVSQLSISSSKYLLIVYLVSIYRKGEKTEYGGGRTEPEIVNWILKKVGPSSNEVTSE